MHQCAAYVDKCDCTARLSEVIRRGAARSMLCQCTESKNQLNEANTA